MTERPILFAGRLVRAILDGRKTQTRRVVSAPPPEGHGYEPAGVVGPWGEWQTPPGNPLHSKWSTRCTYGVAGDRLWVRETWKVNIPPSGWIYRATDGEARDGDDRPWRPSIYMPRAACRIVLEVTEVRVQRLQAITEEDARAEGVERDRHGWRDYLCVGGLPQTTAADSFCTGWESINGKRAPWASNPWVWAITFRRAA